MKKFTLLLVLFAFIFTGAAIAQQKLITGTVTSSQDNKPVVGATVSVKGTTTATLTNREGKYELAVLPKDKTLVITFVRLKTKEIAIGSSNLIDVVLESDVLKLNELIVTGIGISRETKALGYSVQDLGGDVIARSHDANVINSLNGKVAGVQVNSSSGVAGGSSYMTIRGPQTIDGSNQPLFVVDGVPIDNSQSYSGNPDDGENNLTNGVAYSNRAIDLNPEDIASVTVLKGGAASALYGLRGANGVIVVTTKKGRPAVGGKKYSLSFSTSVGFDVVNKLPERQDRWAQGSKGKWSGPETANRNSWGPLMDTMRYASMGFLPTQEVRIILD